MTNANHKPEWKTGQPTAPRRIGAFRRPFGAGILASRPTYRAPASFDDMAWHAEQEATAEFRQLEQAAGEFEAMDRLERGCCL
jgi:hypothetical protein